MSEKEQDERFAKIYQDPRFRTIRKKDKTIQIDKRFKSMFTDDKFTLKYSMDKRGRSKKHLISEDYKKFYRLEEDEGDKIEEVNAIDQNNTNDDKNEEQNDSKLTHSFGYHRGFNFKSKDEEIDDESSASSSESEEDEEEVEELEHNWAELDKDAPQIDDATSRIAICNVDWDRINAQDLYVILNSFKPNTGTINFVRIYYSKFGEKRLQVEENKGPSEFIYGKGKIIEKIGDELSDEEQLHDDDNDDDNDDDFNDNEINGLNAREKLRKYQLDRLKYFYAVVECDSANTAEAIYSELDGMEYESSSTMLDIRFIPDDMNFNDVKLKEECTSMPNSMYKAPLFTNTALQQSNVKITWDETDPKRTDAFNKVFDEDAEDDIKVYLATSSSEEEEEDDNTNSNTRINEDISESEKINKYKNLISMLDKENEKDDYDLEVSWEPSLKTKDDSLEDENELKSKESDDDNLSLENKFDNKLINSKSKKSGKEKFKNKNRKEEIKNENTSNLELLMMDDFEDNTKKKHFNYNEIVDNFKKGTSKDEDDGFKVSFYCD